MVASRADLHPLVPCRRLGAPARPCAGARRPPRDGVARRHERAGSPKGGRRRPKGGSAAERDAREALGRSRGGYGTKACVIADGRGRAVAFRRPVRPMNCPTRFRCSTNCPACPGGSSATVATPATPFVSASGTGAHGLRSRLSATRRPSPARTGSTATATRSSASGPGSRKGAPSPPATRNRRQLHGRPLPRSRPRLAQAMTGPSRGRAVTGSLTGLARSPMGRMPRRAAQTRVTTRHDPRRSGRLVGLGRGLLAAHHSIVVLRTLPNVARLHRPEDPLADS